MKTADRTVDTSGQCCPLPMIALTRAAAELRSGAVLLLIATDPASRIDIPVGVHRLGHDLLEVEEADGAWRYWVQVNGHPTP